MDIISIRKKINVLVNKPSSSYLYDIMQSGFSCVRCGWCCCRNFDIKIIENISRPSNAISIFPDDIRRIMKMKGCKWEDVAEPDRYSCLSDGEDIIVIGWILKRGDSGNCSFYRNGECTIYTCRPMICRSYPFFIGDNGIEIMHCNGLGKKTEYKKALELTLFIKRYELKKLQNYKKIFEQMKNKLNFSSIRTPPDADSNVIVYDGENISRCRLPGQHINQG